MELRYPVEPAERHRIWKGDELVCHSTDNWFRWMLDHQPRSVFFALAEDGYVVTPICTCPTVITIEATEHHSKARQCADCGRCFHYTIVRDYEHGSFCDWCGIDWASDGRGPLRAVDAL